MLKADELIFSFFILLSIVFLIFLINPMEALLVINWKTIISLFYIMVIVNLLKDSGFLEYLSIKIIERTRRIFLTLIFLTLILSMFVTNDISLFIIVPLTLILARYCNLELNKIIILEGIAANIGSSLTPFGNPQNLFIFYHYHLNFTEFVINMIPFEVLGILVILPFLDFKKFCVKRLEEKEFKKVWLIYIFIFILTILSVLNIINSLYLLPIILYILVKKRIRVDILFLLTFCSLFIDIEGLKRLGIIEIFKINFSQDIIIMTYSSLLSQVISNVPTAILLSNLYDNWLAIAYGVNVGGNGSLIASFANLITIRLSEGRVDITKFLKYSFLIYFLHLTTLTIYLLVRGFL
ncbi:Citrate transporter [Methanocaldococcus infernus ME]|uniref:Citrate transporter n=1 Tax=Methanocaldococcus infernus (strain DSM 11812 / JCM 15783 / ME) TaxID=573063 RepID=D5VQG4_METIM|nr:SLC13 family permease [Methanocaldococcus infernus]ADG12817.1 Citrate transporter [Methanocaldococcus infernus ME]